MPAARQKSCAATCNRTKRPRGLHPPAQPKAGKGGPSYGCQICQNHIPGDRAPSKKSRAIGRDLKAGQVQWTAPQRRGGLPRPQSGIATLKGLGPSASLPRGAPPCACQPNATQPRSARRPVSPLSNQTGLISPAGQFQRLDTAEYRATRSRGTRTGLPPQVPLC